MREKIREFWDRMMFNFCILFLLVSFLGGFVVENNRPKWTYKTTSQNQKKTQGVM